MTQWVGSYQFSLCVPQIIYIFSQIVEALKTPQQCRPPTSSHSHASVCESSTSCVRVQLALDTSAVASVTQIPIYGIATDDYDSFKLLIVYVFVPAVLL